MQTGRWDGAAREYSTLLKPDPDSPELRYNLAVAQKHRQDDEGARDLLRRSLELKPDFPAAKFELGETYWQAGMLDEAISQLRELCQTHPDFAPAYFPLAEAQRQKGDLDGALSTVQAVLRLGPNPSAFQQLAILEKQKCDVDGAAKAFHHAEELRNKAKLWQAAQLATAAAKRLMQARDASGAIRKLEFALSIDSGLAETHFQLALALKERHEESRARQEFQKAFELDARLKPPHEP
jgi:tetratricopeptide (TPR) repeat protein